MRFTRIVPLRTVWLSGLGYVLGLIAYRLLHQADYPLNVTIAIVSSTLLFGVILTLLSHKTNGYRLMTDEYFTPEKLAHLKVAYQQAVDDGKDLFTLNNQTYFIGYAKYLIEYLDKRFNTQQEKK